MKKLKEKLDSLIGKTNEEFPKAEKGNKASGTRLRKVMQELRAVCKEIRKEILKLRED